jgi:hypothetical protein
MASSPASSIASSQNPFGDNPPTTVTLTAIQHVNIRTHVPITLDYGNMMFSAWSAFFDANLHKFGLIDHVDDTANAQNMWHNTEWMQIDQCIISWLYTSSWPLPRQRQLAVVYALQEFHGLYQGELFVHDYFSHLKHLSNLLRDGGHPVSDPAMVINTLRGLNSKFSHAISVLTTCKSLPSFLFACGYLLQEESRQSHTTKMEAASALVAGTSSTPPARPPLPPPASTPPATYLSSKNSSKNNNKKRKANDNKKIPSPATSNNAPAPMWSSSFNSWTGVV